MNDPASYTRCETNLICLITARKRNCGNVMFSVVSVILFMGGSPCDHYPWCIVPNCVAPPAPRDIRFAHPHPSTPRYSIPAPPLWTSDMGPPALPWTSDMETPGHRTWNPPAPSPLDIRPLWPRPHQYRHLVMPLKHVRLASW